MHTGYWLPSPSPPRRADARSLVLGGQLSEPRCRSPPGGWGRATGLRVSSPRTSVVPLLAQGPDLPGSSAAWILSSHQPRPRAQRRQKTARELRSPQRRSPGMHRDSGVATGSPAPRPQFTCLGLRPCWTNSVLTAGWRGELPSAPPISGPARPGPAPDSWWVVHRVAYLETSLKLNCAW